MEQIRPDWLKVKYNSEAVAKMSSLLADLSLNTVCKEAGCPNIGECFKNNTATFMIMGNNCTRNCRFCAVSKGELFPLNPKEPENVAIAAKKLQLKHVVITSVTRDDLVDGGAYHFAQTIRAVKEALPYSTIEVLIPDLNGRTEDIDKIICANPDVLNHNIETVPSLYKKVRPEADYSRSLRVLKYVKEKAPSIISKTGLMVGLGEKEEEINAVIDDLVKTRCDILTIGQYLSPSENHLKVKEYISPEKFSEYKKAGEEKGIKFIASAPLVRSSYNALEALNAVRKDS